MPWGKPKEIGSHLNTNGERVYDSGSGDNPFQSIPHQYGDCKSESDHNLINVGTTEIGGVEFIKVECHKTNCTYKGTRPKS